MAEYFSERQLSANSQYAYYPVFILGDSGVSKFIKAKRYSAQEILDGLYDVYRQERRRMALTSAANTKLKEGGYSLIENFSSKENEYTALPFLNKDYKSPDGTVGKYADMIGENPSKQEVVKAIQAYMEEAVSSFKTSLNNLGLLETKEAYNPKTNKKEVQYVYFSQEVNGNKTIDEVIADYYWNTKFATIQQLQLFTIDPAFYNGTKDLQKRYKEIHAPGSVLSLEARDFNGNLYSEDGIERCVYFDDINSNAEVSNPEFMKAIEAKFGKNSQVYKAYTKNTLTDGQGYRTLESYRKVMGMAGKWTQEMENVYNAIKQLRAEYGKDAQIPSDKLTEIANMSVVFQPIKPYMYTIENLAVNSTDKLKIPVQHKYAEAVLIPELLPAGSKLRDMAYWMESKGVDLVGSTKIVKVGGFGSTDISKASNAQELNDALDKAYIHQLSYGDYRIQTNVPEHINSSQLFGTQVRKLIMANIKMDDYHYENYVGGSKVNLGGKYGEVRLNGRNLVSFYNSLIVANILESYDLFANEVSDIKKLSDKLLQTTINNSRESMDNMLAYSLTGDNKFLVPLFEGALEHDSSAMLFSIFKKRVNKQSIKGGSAVQVSAMGIKGYEESGDLHYVVDPNNPNNILYAECEIPWDISYTDINGKEVALEFSDYCNEDGTLKTDKDGNTLLEKKFPNALSILAYRIPTERDYSMINLRVKRFSQKTAGGTIKVPAQGTTIAGFDFDIDKLYFMRNEYRQRELSSSEVAEIWKEFYETYPNIKDVLKEAREEDIESLDRLYKYWDKAGLPYSYKEAFAQFIADRGYISFESYDFSKSPLDNTRAARNNMLIKLIQERLMDYETFEQRYTPGGFANASKAARTLRELLFGNLEGIVSKGTVDFNAIAERAKDSKSDPEPNYDPSDPMTIITYNQQNQVAGKLIGIFANQNTNHAFSSLMSEFTLKDPIRFAGHSYSDLLHAPEGIDVDLNVAEFLAASVDAVKDPVLNFLNLNTITADAGAVLARIGYTTQEIGLLLNQPIIKEICEYSFNNGVTADMAMREVVKNYMGDDTESPKANPDEDFSINKLALNIVNDRVMREQGKNAMDNQSFKADQLKVAELFSQIQTVAGDISQFVTSSKFTASNAVGSTFGDLYSQQMKVKNYIDKFVVKNGKNALSVNMKVTDIIDSPITNNTNLQGSNQEYLESLIENPLAYEQAMYDMNRRAGMLLNSYYPYNTPSYSGARNRLAELTKSNFLDADTINSIHSDMLVYMLSQQEDSLFNGEIPTKNGIPAREYYTRHFAKEVFNTLESNPDLKTLPLFQYMQFVTNEKTGDISMNVQGIGGLAPYQKDELKESWAELLKTEPDLARDLFMYNFYKLGFTFSPLAFMNLAPTELKLAIKVGRKWDSSANDGNGAWVERSYIDFLNEVKEGTVTANSEKFAKQYILNHLDNRRLVFTAKGSNLKYLKTLVYKNGEAVSNFTLDVNKLGDDAKNYTIKDSTLPKNCVAFRPCIVVDGITYMCESTNDKFNVSYDGSITYYKVSQLGTTNKSLQYVSDSESRLTDSEQYNNNTEGNSSQEFIPEDTPTSFNREEAINQIIDYGIRNGEFMAEQVESIKEYLNSQSDTDLSDTVNAIKSEIQSNGLTDNTGEKVC